jgi:hypothetical protein
MIYATAIAYSSGDTSNIFRPINSGSVICGGADSLAMDYPYIYFSNPLDMQGKRYCVKSCPTFDSSGSMPATWADTYGGAITFDFTIDSTGTASGSYAIGDDLGYESELTIERVCIPSLTVFKGAFSSYTA